MTRFSQDLHPFCSRSTIQCVHIKPQGNYLLSLFVAIKLTEMAFNHLSIRNLMLFGLLILSGVDDISGTTGSTLKAVSMVSTRFLFLFLIYNFCLLALSAWRSISYDVVSIGSLPRLSLARWIRSIIAGIESV